MEEVRCPEYLPPATLNGITFPTVQCTKRADTDHIHDWVWKEDERWEAKSH